jgi:two-component system sensor histidine kinase BaeS
VALRRQGLLPPPAQPGGQAQQPPPYALVDQNRVVIIPSGPYLLGARVPRAVLDSGNSINVNGQNVGTVLATGQSPARNQVEEKYVARINQALLIVAVGGVLLALILGLLLARTLTRPVRELTAATRAMAKGELEQQVPVRSRDELGELTTAFNQMSADLTRSNQSRRQMTADIAHDLRTPLTVLAGYLESLRDGVLKPTRERFDVMHQEAQHLQHLVDDLRTLSLADAGELSLNRQLIPPQDLLERLATAYEHTSRQKNLTLQVQAAPDLPEIQVDVDRMVQVLENLVSNAMRYTPAGGTITLSAKRDQESVLLKVTDTGAGILPQNLPHIFDRFYRADQARQQAEGESGLGLAIAKSIVEAHGGKISAESKPGRGSTFMVALPVD